MDPNEIQRILEPQFQFVKSLNPDAEDALIKYTRGSNGLVCKSIEKCFVDVPALQEEILVFRCPGGLGVEILKSRNTYISVTRNSVIARKFISRCGIRQENGLWNKNILAIRIPAGSHVIPLENLSKFQSEQEVLLHWDAKFDYDPSPIAEYDDEGLIYVVYKGC